MRSLLYPEKRRLRDAYKRRVRAEADVDRQLLEYATDGVPYSELAAVLEITKSAVGQRLAVIRGRAVGGAADQGSASHPQGSPAGGARPDPDLSERRGPS